MSCVGFRHRPAGGRVRRLLSGCVVALIGLTGAISVTAGIAEAGAKSVTVISSSPASPTTSDGTSPTTLTWGFDSSSGGSFCELVRDGSTVAPLAACTGTVSYPVTTFGTYTFELFSEATDGRPAASSLVTVTPPAPAVAVRAVPPTSRGATLVATPQWQFVLLPDAIAMCTLIDPQGHPVGAASRCVSPYTAVGGSGATAGRYTLSVTQTVTGVVSPASSSSFTTRTRPVKRVTVRTAIRPALKPAIEVPPDAPTLTADADSGASPFPTFTLDYDPAATPNCVVSDPDVPVTKCATTPTLDLSNAPPGIYTLSVDVTDSDGTSDPATADYDYEPVAPATPVVTAPAGPGTSRTPTFAVSDAEDTGSNLTYHCTVAGPASVTIADSACVANTVVKLKSLRDGVYTLSVTATDGSGLTSDAGSDSYTLDTTTPAPTVTQTSPAGVIGISPTVTYDIASTETPDGPADLSCVWTPPGGPSPAASPCPADGTFTAVDGDGTYTLAVTGTDTIGNTNTTTVSYTYDDATGTPQVTLTSGETTPSPAASVTYKISAIELLDGPDAFSCDWVGPDGIDPGAVPCTSPATFAAPVDGDYTLTVVGTDLIGNQQTRVVTYRRDSITPPPVVALVGPEQTPSSLGTPSFSITDSEALDGPDTFSCDWISPKLVDSGPLPCGTNFTYDVTKLGTGRNGVYTLTVTATDGAGNTNSSTFVYTYDASTPAPVVTLAVGDVTPSNSTSVAYTITDAEATSGPDVLSCDWVDPNGVDLGTTDCSAGFFATTAPDGDGVYTLTVTARDKVLNTNSTTVAYTLDTQTPVPVVGYPDAQRSLSNVASPNFVLSDTEVADTFRCLWVAPDGTTISNAPCSSTPSLNTAGRGDGAYHLTVTAIDPLGNTATAAPVKYTYDSSTPPPTVGLLIPLTSPSNVPNPTFSISDTESADTFSCLWTGPGASGAPVTCTSGAQFPATADGSYLLDVTALDPAGNKHDTIQGFVLDRTPPATPHVGLAQPGRSNTPQPIWTWRFSPSDPDPDPAQDYTASCTITGPNGYFDVQPQCPQTFSYLLGGGVGPYKLQVVLTDEAGNSTSSSWVRYVWDPSAPAGPTVLLVHPITSNGASLDRHPEWTVSTPNNATDSCTLIRGGRMGTPVRGPAPCVGSVSYDLSGFNDGLFTLEVVANYPGAGTASDPTWDDYIVIPDAPTVSPPTSQNPWAVWGVQGNPHDQWVCKLHHDSRVVDVDADCGRTPTYSMADRPTGRYRLSVVQYGAEKARSAVGSATWIWKGDVTTPPPSTTPPGSDPHNTVGSHPKPSPTGPAPIIVRVAPSHPKAIAKEGSRLSGPVKVITKTLTGTAGRASAILAKAVSAGGGTSFPLILLGLVLIFILVQNRIDRRDPKLALASITADDLVEFQPPPSRRDQS